MEIFHPCCGMTTLAPPLDDDTRTSRYHRNGVCRRAFDRGLELAMMRAELVRNVDLMKDLRKEGKDD